jgi:hypothetical protein
LQQLSNFESERDEVGDWMQVASGDATEAVEKMMFEVKRWCLFSLDLVGGVPSNPLATLSLIVK